MKSPKVAAVLVLAFTFVSAGIQPTVPQEIKIVQKEKEKEKEKEKVSPVEKFRNSKKLNGIQLAAILAHVGFRGSSHKIAWALAMRESHGNPLSHNRNSATADDSYGLFQINMRGYLGKARRVTYGLSRDSKLFDPLTNAWVAYRMSHGGKDFGPWGIGPHAYRANRGIRTISRFFALYPGYPKTKAANKPKKSK